VAQCDLIFLCMLPFQAQQVLKDVRYIVVQRNLDAMNNKSLTRPLFVSCLAATGIPKLKIMLTEDSVFLKTQVNVVMIKDDLFKSRNDQMHMKNNTQ
jgi:pyrroline-5-carboxylate reductase